VSRHITTASHPIADPAFAAECAARLDSDNVVVLRGFFTPESVEQAAAESARLEEAAFYSNATSNVYLTATDPTLPDDHAFNRPVVSNKGLIADDLIAEDSPLREIYEDSDFRTFLKRVLGLPAVYPYPDKLSSIVISVAGDGMELGWHFDTSASSITMLLQASEAGGVFEYMPGIRDSDTGEMGFELVDQVLDGILTPHTLEFDPGDLVLFRGRDALHRVTPVVGPTTRSIAIFAFNETPDASMSDQALMTFFGRTA